ncbi:MAG: hypothetical protein E4H18_05605, partial [Hyphomicrobiales bacterium]
LHFFAVDKFSQAEAAQQAEIEYDASLPTVSIRLAGTLLAGDWYSGTVTATVTADGAGVDVTSVETKADAAAWAAYTDPVAVSGDGRHTLLGRVTTANGKTAQTSTLFGIDTAPAAATLTLTPATPNGALEGWYKTAPTVRITASDAGSGVKEIHYSFDAAGPTIVPGGTATLSLPEGEHVLSFFAVDNLGQAGAEQQTTLRLDRAGPVLGMPVLDPPHPSASEDVQVSVEATDAGTGVQVVSFWYSIGGQLWQRIGGRRTGDTYTAVIPATGEPTLVYCNVSANDRNGNTTDRSGFSYYTGDVDLCVAELSYSGDLRDGGMSNVVASLANNGLSPFNGYAMIDLFVDGICAGREEITYLGPDGIRTNVTFPWVRSAGDHVIRVIIDPANTVPEFDETNNMREEVITVPVPNLIAENLVVPPAIIPGQAVTFTADLRSEAGTTRTFVVSFRIDGSQIASYTFNGIGNSQVVPFSASWLGNSGAAAVSVVVDASSAVPETSEADNTASQALPHIAAPDFAVASFDVLVDGPLPGDNVGVRAVVDNLGAAYVGPVQVAFTVDGSTRSTSILNGMQTGTLVTVSAEWRAEPGRHVLGVRIDPAGSIREANEQNNASSSAIDVPGLALSSASVNIWSNTAGAAGMLLRNSGSLPLTVETVTESASWLTLDTPLPLVLAAGQLVSLQFSIAPVPAGQHDTV